VPLCLAVWFLFVEALGVNIGAGLLEGFILQWLGREQV
jgi:putative tricarboxylic transport membrane protein